MFSSPTTYRSGTRTAEVLPGESHSAAWAYVLNGGPAPSSYPCSHVPVSGRVRRRVHRPARRPAHRRRPLTPIA